MLSAAITVPFPFRTWNAPYLSAREKIINFITNNVYIDIKRPHKPSRRKETCATRNDFFPTILNFMLTGEIMTNSVFQSSGILSFVGNQGIHSQFYLKQEKCQIFLVLVNLCKHFSHNSPGSRDLNLDFLGLSNSCFEMFNQSFISEQGYHRGGVLISSDTFPIVLAGAEPSLIA